MHRAAQDRGPARGECGGIGRLQLRGDDAVGIIGLRLPFPARTGGMVRTRPDTAVRVIDLQQRAAGVPRMQLQAAIFTGIIQIVRDTNSHVGEMFQPRFDRVTIQGDHIAALTAPPLEITSGGGAVFGGRDDFQERVAERHQRVDQTVFRDVWIHVRNHRTEHRADGGDRRLQMRRDEADLAQA
jgi:hypothetical protein